MRQASRVSTARSACSLLLALVVASPSADAGVLYAITLDFDEVHTIDTATGAATYVGTVGDTIGDIAFDVAGVLHAVDRDVFDMGFFGLDPTTGSATLIAGTGGPGGEGALAYDRATNRFYSRWQGFGGGSTAELVAIDAGTGAVTFIGNLGLAVEADISGMAMLPDGRLLAYDPQSALPSRLLEIDEATAVVTVVGPIGDTHFSGTGGLAYDCETETLYMSNGYELWTVDPDTGAGTLVGPHGLVDGVTGLSVLSGTCACMLGLDYTSTLYDVDALTGAGTNPRALGESKFGGLAMDATGALFGMRAAPIPELHSIDPLTGVATLIGPLGIPHLEGGLDFHPLTGELFGVGGQSELFLLDTTTGAATIVGTLVDETGDPIDPSAVAFDADGDLFVLKAASAPPEIYRVDPADGSVLARVPLPGLPLADDGGMGFDDSTGLLYLSYGSFLYVANPTTGASIPLGPTPARTALEVIGPCDPPPPRFRPRSPLPSVLLFWRW